MTYKKYLCKKTEDGFQKDWAYDFEKQSRKKQKTFYKSYRLDSNSRPTEIYEKDFKKRFVEYKGQPLTMTEVDTNPNPLDKSDNSTYTRGCIMVLFAISAIVAFVIHIGEEGTIGPLSKVPNHWITIVASILLLIGFMEFWFIRTVKEAKENNIKQITFGATVVLKLRSFIQSLLTVVGGYCLFYWIAGLIKAIFNVIVPVLTALGIIAAVVLVLGGFFYLNYKLQKKILRD